MLNSRLPRVDASRFSMVPSSDVPRSTFVTTHSLKTTFDSGWLVPILVEEVLPGDVFKGDLTIFARLATPVFPIMDGVWIDTFFFFCPNRLAWPNWKKMMGERTNPADSISYTTPQIVSPAGGFAIGDLYDYMGLPCVGQITAGQTISVNALPFRMYNFIWNEWFRDQNLQNSIAFQQDDGPDPQGNYPMKKRNKKHDYFTSALPWPLKGGVETGILSGTAPVRGLTLSSAVDPTDGTPAGSFEYGGVVPTGWAGYVAGNNLNFRTGAAGTGGNPLVYADLGTATGVTINALRLAVQTQRLLERDARSGTRYTELLQAHFRVTPEDTRLQRPEYIGGGSTSLQTQAIPQTSATGLTGGTSALGSLGAAATATDQHKFTLFATEHGFIIGLANLRADITYQQGLRRFWTRQTRYDHYWPVFAHLGEQAIRNDELYCTGDDAVDPLVFGYQERWAEYRHRPSQITGKFRSTSAGTIDPWHLSQRFTVQPSLNETFIQENPPFARVLAAGSGAAGQQMTLLWDSVFKIKNTRPMPMFSVPGMMDRF